MTAAPNKSSGPIADCSIGPERLSLTRRRKDAAPLQFDRVRIHRSLARITAT